MKSMYKIMGIIIVVMMIGMLVLGCDNPSGGGKKGDDPVYVTVTFNSNGGSDVEAKTGIVSGSAITLPTAPVKDTYTFAGWFMDNGEWQSPFTSSTLVTADITVYAKWTANPVYVTVTFDSNGGSEVEAKSGIISGSAITLPTAPVKDTYTFAGWFMDNGEWQSPFTSSTLVTADITVYAKWTIVMMQIPAGTFTMGQAGIATPVHEVTLSAFYMGECEITQEQYEEVMGNNPSYYTGSPAPGEVQRKRPVEQVSWYDAILFCNRLSMKEGLNPVYSVKVGGVEINWETVNAPTNENADWDAVVCNWNANGYRLPTEAEWEYACRAGKTTAYYTGDTEDDALKAAAWYSENSNNKTHEVGKKATNAWGLYDMHGNVYEWCWDWYGAYASAAQTNPKGASSGTPRVDRGGSWIDGAGLLRSAYRGGSLPIGRGSDFGFRVLRPQV